MGIDSWGGWGVIVNRSVVGFWHILFVQPEKPQLQERIETVERAIGSLEDLEKQLIDIKRDMVETEKAAKAIEQEYVKAKELEKLTQEQFEAVKSALRSQSWQKTAFNYGLGFVLGIASSLIASVIYSRTRQHRALREEKVTMHNNSIKGDGKKPPRLMLNVSA